VGIGFSVGYLDFIVFLLLFSGVLVLYFDVNTYSKKQMAREMKGSRIMAWLNISLSVVTFIGNWIIQRIT